MSLSVMSPAASSRTLIFVSSEDSWPSARVDRAQRARDVRLEDDPQLLGLARLHLAVQVLERRATGAGALAGGGLVLAGLDLGAGDLLVRDDADDVAGLGHVRQAEDDRGRRRPGLRDPLAGRALERLDLAVRVARDDDVADVERAGLDDDRRDRAAALVELRLDDRAHRVPLRVRLELLQVGDEQDDLEQLLDARRGSSPTPAPSARRRRSPRRRRRPRRAPSGRGPGWPRAGRPCSSRSRAAPWPPWRG